jgi:hypothetical protein
MLEVRAGGAAVLAEREAKARLCVHFYGQIKDRPKLDESKGCGGLSCKS